MKRKNTMLPLLGGVAAVRADSVDEEARTFDIVWTTGARVRRKRWVGEDYDEELVVSSAAIRLERLNNGAPFLNAHNAWSIGSVLGSVVPGSAKIENGDGVATIRFSDAEEDEAVWRKIKGGVIRNVSVGYRVWKYEVEKREGEIELRRAVDWEPYEISAVPIGADPKAQIRQDNELNECLLIPHGHDNAADTAKQERSQPMANKNEAVAGDAGGQATSETRSDQPKADAQDATTPAVDADNIRTEERERIAGINDLAARFNLGDDFAKSQIENGRSLPDAKQAALDELAKRDGRDVGQSQVSEPAKVTRAAEDKFLEGASNAIIVRAGQAGMVQKSLGADAPRIDPGEFRGRSLVDLGRYYLELQGVRSGALSGEEIYKRTLHARAAGGQGTGDFGVLLETTMHKVLLGAYMTTPDTWSRFCKSGSVSDLRAHNRYRLGSFGSLDSLNEHGEFKNKPIPDGERYTIQAKTKGNIIALTRQAFIHDDIGAFSGLASMFGRAAKLTIELDVYKLLAENGGLGPTLADGRALFHADHSNIAANGAISVDVFDDMGVKMGEQQDVSGNEVLDLRPAVLLTSLGSRGEAVVINGAEYDPDTSGKLQRPNKVRGLFSDIVGTARLSGPRVYGFADPDIAPVIEVAFLNGQTEPFLDSEEGWRVDGTEWKVRLDYGVAGQDYRGAVTAKGAP